VDPDAKLLLPKTAFTSQYIEILGIDLKDVVFYHHQLAHRYHTKRLHMVSWASTDARERIEPFSAFYPPRFVLQRIRSTILGLSPPGDSDSLVVYVSRGETATRSVKGESELINRLRDTLGAKNLEVSYGNTTIREQIALFSRATVVVGPHGAGTHNILTCGNLIICFKAFQISFGHVRAQLLCIFLCSHQSITALRILPMHLKCGTEIFRNYLLFTMVYFNSTTLLSILWSTQSGVLSLPNVSNPSAQMNCKRSPI
jgi:hypothetical protein